VVETFGREYTDIQVYSWKALWDLTKNPPEAVAKFSEIEFETDDLANFNGYVFKCDSMEAKECKQVNPTTRGQSVWTFMPDLICATNKDFTIRQGI
jgi:hypothetical protein